MKSTSEGFSYNERLFAVGIRAFFHFARFHWFQNELKRRCTVPRKVLKLGCFGGKVLRCVLWQVLYRHVPRALIERPKQGFGVRFEHWLRVRRGIGQRLCSPIRGCRGMDCSGWQQSGGCGENTCPEAAVGNSRCGTSSFSERGASRIEIQSFMEHQ
jgi:hypothetical protein